jgi:hypothetical protein
MGDLFVVELAPHNRWAGAKVLRDCWQTHIDAALSRPLLIVDEPRRSCPPCSPSCGCSHSRARRRWSGCGAIALEELLPFGSRVRVRLASC